MPPPPRTSAALPRPPPASGKPGHVPARTLLPATRIRQARSRPGPDSAGSQPAVAGSPAGRVLVRPGSSAGRREPVRPVSVAFATTAAHVTWHAPGRAPRRHRFWPDAARDHLLSGPMLDRTISFLAPCGIGALLLARCASGLESPLGRPSGSWAGRGNWPDAAVPFWPHGARDLARAPPRPAPPQILARCRKGPVPFWPDAAQDHFLSGPMWHRRSSTGPVRLGVRIPARPGPPRTADPAPPKQDNTLEQARRGDCARGRREGFG
jgi:hypothetical protein